MSEKGSNHQLLKQSNYNLIKKYIYRNSPISRVEIAQKLGLTTATITGMVNPMISSGLLVETTAPAEETKGAGRPRMMLEFAAEAYYICGVDTGPYRTNYIMTDLLGNTVAVRRTNQPLGDYQGTLERLAEEIPAFLRETGIPREKILGVGICLPGMIDGSADKIYDIFQDGWTEHSISTELGERIGLKVEVENNVRARAISAELFDRMVKAEPFAYFFVSFGIACQMIIDGKVLYGQSAAAGEIGHTVVQRNGPVCPTCGNRGCLEALTGERAILQQCRDKGKVYESSMHGFARDMEHAFVDQTADTLVLELCSCPETLARFPYEFRLVSTFTLENDTLHHSLTVENLDSDRMPFGIGYHPGYTVPFDDKHVATDYELRFSEMESPICVNCLPTGLVQKDHYFLPANINALPIDEALFANDSHCMVNLKSATLGIYEKGTGRAVVCNIAEFPYVLIWSKPGMPKFVCIEPWHSLPSAEGGSIKWEEKPAAAILNPGEAWSCTLSTSFVR